MQILIKDHKNRVLENPSNKWSRLIPATKKFTTKMVRGVRYKGAGNASIQYQALNKAGEWVCFLKKHQPLAVKKRLPVAKDLTWPTTPKLVKVGSTASTSTYCYISEPYEVQKP